MSEIHFLLLGTLGPPPPAFAPYGTAQAIYSIRIAWDRFLSGYFTLGRSALSGPDPLAASAFSVPGFTGTYDDVTAYATGYKITRGRTATLETVQAGSIELDLIDPGYMSGGVWHRGLFNPQNTASPLYGRTDRPLREISVRAQDPADAAWYGRGLFYLTDLDYRPAPNIDTVHITGQDLFLRLDRAKPVIPQAKNLTTGSAIGLVLDSIGFTETAYRALDVGDPIAVFGPFTGDQSGLQIIADLLATEFGLFYIGQGGVATYHDHNAKWGYARVATIVQGMSAIGPGSSLSHIINSATFQAGDTGIPQTYTDEDSKLEYDLSSYGPVVSPYLRNDSDAYAKATYVVYTRKDAKGPLWELKLDNRTGDLLTAMLRSDVLSRLNVSQAGSNTVAADYHVERLEEEVTATPRRHKTSYVLSERGPDPFFLNASSLGGPDPLAP